MESAVNFQAIKKENLAARLSHLSPLNLFVIWPLGRRPFVIKNSCNLPFSVASGSAWLLLTEISLVMVSTTAGSIQEYEQVILINSFRANAGWAALCCPKLMSKQNAQKLTWTVPWIGRPSIHSWQETSMLIDIVINQRFKVWWTLLETLAFVM